MEIVRKQLSSAEIIPRNQRYNTETDTVEFSPDGGVTWFPMPSLDPRHSPAFLYPPLGIDERCNAAANMVKWMKDFLDGVTELLNTGATALTIANFAIPLYELISGGSLTLLAIITELGASLFTLGYSALLSAFDDATYAALLCCFDCNIGSDGQVTADQLVGVESQVTSDLSTTAALVVNSILFLQGETGLSNAGAIGDQTGDCDACECAWCYDLTLDADSLGFVPLDDPDWGIEGSFAGGWNATTASHAGNGATQLSVYGGFPDANYRKVTARVHIDLGATNPDIHVLRLSINGGGSGVYVVESHDLGSVELVLEFNKSGAGIDIRVEGIAAFGTTAEVLLNPGAIVFTSVKMEGVGSNPFGDDNC